MDNALFDDLPPSQVIHTLAGTEHTLATEVPLAITLNGVNHAVMMVSPCQLEAFVTGFLLTEGIIAHHRDIHDLEFSREQDAIITHVTLANRCHQPWLQQKRSLAGRSGCGLCGLESLQAALPDLPVLPITALPDTELLTGLRAQLPEWQVLNRNCGALHGAFFVDHQGQIRHASEDVGRHNALDKLLGWQHHQPVRPEGMILMTSRCSIELVQKMVRSHNPTLLTLSAPTRLAVEQARHYRLNLIHLPYQQAPRVYAASAHSC
ncbi:formate dehydrogenase accessory sulfurtransferase FdhD [Oceanimonas baumannii]|uniref:Sulfur carrier protein FdhD n=1 Tax=Oceanimonas baumannii TaxID=129578 RepID=A0A235CME9_9GAMM|nr:formate dehydrogenase accessory sulfurtransferase FdhD [Oceanimonas baumannii]OYD25554.1 formate dehydrogenase family accessory protein FdhD [Oceanimonas baumannii]TDW61240.1 FdhD protein [Oceanimonas baumannii]